MPVAGLYARDDPGNPPAPVLRPAPRAGGDRLRKTGGQQQDDFAQPAVGLEAIAGLVVHQLNHQQLAHQAAQAIVGVAGVEGSLVVEGKKITVEARQPAAGERQNHHRVGLAAAQTPGAVAVHYFQPIDIQQLMPLTVMQADAALQRPQQRQRVALRLAELTNIANRDAKVA